MVSVAREKEQFCLKIARKGTIVRLEKRKRNVLLELTVIIPTLAKLRIAHCVQLVNTVPKDQQMQIQTVRLAISAFRGHQSRVMILVLIQPE